MKKIRSFLPHLSVSLALALIVLIILDGYNPAMGFLNSTVSKVFYLVFCIVAICLSFLVIREDRKH